MKNIFDAFKELDYFVVAHRGASSDAPENTLASFGRAIADGAHFIEMDVQVTSDGIPIVFHDKGLSRTTDGVGFASTQTFEQLRKLDSGGWFKKEFSGERIPSLEEVLQFVEGKIFLNIELKNLGEKSEQSIATILDLINRYNYADKLVISSFYYEQLKIVKKLEPDVPIAPIRVPKDNRLPSQLRKLLGCQGFVCSVEELTNEVADDARKHNIFIGVYSVDTEEQLDFVTSRNGKAIVTNKPREIIALLRHKYKAKV